MGDSHSEMPFGYRWIVKEDLTERSQVALDTCLPFNGGTIIQWDCMVEFGWAHDHDPEACERLMAGMNPEPFYDDVPYTPYTFYETRY